MTEDERRTAALHSFYEAYRELQQYDNLRLHTHSSIYEKDDALIEIYRYQGEKKGERILKVTQEDEEILRAASAEVDTSGPHSV